jgi:hypothetical protein
VVAGAALAPLPALAEEFEGFSLENLSIGLEFSYLSKGLGAKTAISGTAQMPNSGAFAADVESTIDKVNLTEVLTKVAYQINGHFVPYLLVGVSGVSFDDDTKVDVASLLSTHTTVGYSALGFAYGFGTEGVLMELPAEMQLSYGVRMFAVKSSDDTSIPPEDVSSQLSALDPLEKVNVSTGASYSEWDFSLGLSRDYQLDESFVVTPQIGFRHSSITMKVNKDIEYSPGMPNYIEGQFDQSLGGTTNSVTLGVAGSFQEFLSGSLEVALGDELGITLAVGYGF